MTKVTILGDSHEDVKPKKKIEFVKYISSDKGIYSSNFKPSYFKNIELICSGYGEYDLMFAYDCDRNSGRLYLGHFNGGVV